MRSKAVTVVMTVGMIVMVMGCLLVGWMLVSVAVEVLRGLYG